MAVEGLPSCADAVSDPENSAAAVQMLVRSSLSAEWRANNSDELALRAVFDVTQAHLDALENEEGDQESSGHEESAAACIKLARNLCAGRPDVQEFWHSLGLAKRLTSRVRKDAASVRGRGATWCEAVPSFLANSVAGNSSLRAKACSEWFPYDIAAVCMLSWRRPELALMLLQNLAGKEEELGDDKPDGQKSVTHLVSQSKDGICVLHVTFSLLFAENDSEAQGKMEKAWEWTTVVLNELWTKGVFPHVFRGLKQLNAKYLHDFLRRLVEAPEPTENIPPPPCIGYLAGRLCGQAEVLSLLWSSIDGLLDAGQSRSKTNDRAELLKRFLGDSKFTDILVEEMAGMISRLTAEWQVDWCPDAPSDEAAALLGLEASDLDPLTLASSAASAGSLQGGGRATGVALFRDLCSATATLTAAARPCGVSLPPRLVGACLVANVSCLDALHRKRFGNVLAGEVKEKPSLEAAEASQALCLVEQVRVCGNLLYENFEAQEFLRLTGGLRVLLSHCYSDEQLPMLRETAIFAVRNATHGNELNQKMGKDMLAEQRARAASVGGPPLTDVGLD